MGCGQAKNRGAESPKASANHRAWEAKGKLPVVVMKGWAKSLGIPYLHPNRRFLPGKTALASDDFACAAVPYDIQIAHYSPEPISMEAEVAPLFPIVHTEVQVGVLLSDRIEPDQPSFQLAASPLASLDPADSDSDPPYPDDTTTEERRKLRLAREQEAERLAATLAAEQRAALEIARKMQEEQLDEQRNRADEIMAKYA